MSSRRRGRFGREVLGLYAIDLPVLGARILGQTRDVNERTAAVGSKFATRYAFTTAAGRKNASVTVRAASGLQPVDELTYAPSPRPATRPRHTATSAACTGARGQKIYNVPRALSRTLPPRGYAAERVATAADWQRPRDFGPFAFLIAPVLCYNNATMKTMKTNPVLERLVDPLSECLTPEAAKRLLKLKADRHLQARVNYLAHKCNEGGLTREERSEYESYVSFGTFVALLKSKARLLLSKSPGA